MARVYANFIEGTTDADPGSGGTTLSGAFLASAPAISGSDILVLVLDPESVSGAPEVVHVTAHTASATTATIERAQEGSVARAHPTGTKVVASITKAGLDDKATDAELTAHTGNTSNPHSTTAAQVGATPSSHVGTGGTEHADAVAAGAAGFMTGADKTKLDGIATGAQVNDTAAQILAKLVTVDGAGSGLDADLLDGSSSAAFATSGHNHSGVYDVVGHTHTYVPLAGGTMTGPLLLPQGSSANPSIKWSGETNGDSGIWFPGQSIIEIVSQGLTGDGGLVVRNDGTGNKVHPKQDNATGMGMSGLRWTDVWAVNGTIQTSDPAEKRDVRGLAAHLDPVDMVRSVAPVAFRWRDGERVHAGFDADELGAHLASRGKDLAAFIDPAAGGEEGPKGIRYSELVAVLWEMVRDLDRRVQELEGA